MIGVGAFVYATLHILLYIADEKFDLVKVALEIVKRLYLTIGFIAWLGLLALAITSNDTMVKQLGAQRWRRLHQVTYVVAFLSLIHFFQQTKADFTLPATISGLFGWLMVYRAVAAWKGAGALDACAVRDDSCGRARDLPRRGDRHRALVQGLADDGAVDGVRFRSGDPAGLVRAGRRACGLLCSISSVRARSRRAGARSHARRQRGQAEGGVSLVERQRA